MLNHEELVKAYSDYVRALGELKACQDALNEARRKETVALIR